MGEFEEKPVAPPKASICPPLVLWVLAGLLCALALVVALASVSPASDLFSRLAAARPFVGAAGIGLIVALFVIRRLAIKNLKARLKQDRLTPHGSLVAETKATDAVYAAVAGSFQERRQQAK